MTADRSGVPVSPPVTDADVYVVSFPKCGRTWLRALMAKAISTAHGIPLEVCRDLNLFEFSTVNPALPRIVFWHDDHVHRRSPAELSLDKSFYRDRKVVLLVRDIRDTAVSRYFQQSRRGDTPYTAGLGSFLREEHGSVRTCLAFWNIWHAHQDVPAAFLLTSYERLTADTVGELARVLRFCGLPTGEEVLRTAVEFADFTAMRAMEVADTLGTHRLRPALPGDPESFKTRRGVVGGFRDYLTGEQSAHLVALVHRFLAPPWHPAALAAEAPHHRTTPSSPV
ncbi:sulfotransferase domain-containing protein [Streptomyces sp. UNOC14_S4]|uniref:sulfotransferase domain-containing protein n=1 Tax=Streptomyces sp. UNOC14_S4 TaxID=2872340 RepID=UPI001E484A66|nr:sulfotransferase domain-containing protein [Streptomyces sp. UNOC14_S4]MCC3771941.1 sulfotransferase domain-containing protein [Streptomyces sp. UNOC14_S4]